MAQIKIALLNLLNRLGSEELGMSWESIGISSQKCLTWRRQLCRSGGDPVEVDAESIVKVCTALHIQPEDLPLDYQTKLQVRARLQSQQKTIDDTHSPLVLLTGPEKPESTDIGDLAKWLSERLQAFAGRTACVARTAAQCLASADNELAEVSEPADSLLKWMTSALEDSPEIFGLCVAYEPKEFCQTEDAAFYVRKTSAGVMQRTDFPSQYSPHYRSWDWYSQVKTSREGTWVTPFFDKGGGDVWMVTYSTPMLKGRQRGFVGVATVDICCSEFSLVDEWLNDVASGIKMYTFITSGKQFIKPPPTHTLPVDHPEQDNSRFAEVLDIVSRKTGDRLTITDPISQAPATLCFRSVGSTTWKVGVVAPQATRLDVPDAIIQGS